MAAQITMETKPKIIIIFFILIAFVGIFLRTYHFSDWLRFNADQGRDAALAISSAEGDSGWPLLGPEAGGTEFKLGPAFYYFQIVSMKIFSSLPQVGAYPDLFFSLLAIVLFFLLSRIYFSPKISLALTWLYAISYFSIKYSRFAWNPNSTPFFAMLYLYALYKLATADENRQLAWAIIAGLALGIAVQLHTTLLIILPVLTILAFAFFVKKELIKKTAITSLLAVAILVNIPQIISEIKTKGFNSYQFILGATDKNGRNSSMGRNLLLDLSCHIKTNYHILSSAGDEDSCDYKSTLDGLKKLDSKKLPVADKASFLLFFTLTLTFSVGGYWLLFREMKNAADKKTGIFLKLIGVYVALFFLFSILWATELSVRFFLPLSFVPFLLLGFWIKFLSEKTKKQTLVILIAILAFSFFNLQKVFSTYKDLRFGGREINGNFEYITLGEAKYIISFIKGNSAGKTAHIDAQAGYLFKFLRPLQFLAQEENLEIAELNKDIKLSSGSKLFYVKSADRGCELPQKTLIKYDVEKCSLYRQFSVFMLKVKPHTKD